jgi:cytochrome c peroxidase
MPLRMFPTNANPFEAKYKLLEDGGAVSKGGQRGTWRVASLRNVALTGPWLHNGSVSKLEEVVRIMATAQLGAIVGGEGPNRKLFWSPGSRELV